MRVRLYYDADVERTCRGEARQHRPDVAWCHGHFAMIGVVRKMFGRHQISIDHVPHLGACESVLAWAAVALEGALNPRMQHYIQIVRGCVFLLRPVARHIVPDAAGKHFVIIIRPMDSSEQRPLGKNTVSTIFSGSVKRRAFAVTGALSRSAHFTRFRCNQTVQIRGQLGARMLIVARMDELMGHANVDMRPWRNPSRTPLCILLVVKEHWDAERPAEERVARF